MLYRILTENKNKVAVISAIAEHFAGFTVIEAMGYWRGAPEPCLIIEVDGTEGFAPCVEQVANIIRIINDQDAVLVQAIGAVSTFVGNGAQI